MSNDDNFFSLKSGMFATCSGIWDKATRKYRTADSTEVARCCSKQCIQPVNWCYKYCIKHATPRQEFNDPNKLARCMETCNDERKLCLDTCTLSSPHVGMDNNYIQCAEKYGCTKSNIPDKDCVVKHKDKIFECCRRTCIPTKDLDCQQHCEYIQSVILNSGSITGVPDERPTFSTLKSRFKLYPQNTWVYILGGISLGIIGVIIWVFVIQRKLK